MTNIGSTAMPSHRITLPRLMELGGGSLAQLPSLLQALGGRNPLLIADSMMLGLGVAAKVEKSLQGAGMDFQLSQCGFFDVMPEPTEASLLPVIKKIQANEFDSIIALGGGSAIDSAKAVAILAKYGGAMRDYKVPRVVDELGLPLVAIPTTAGTGSEATQFTIITDQDSDEKMLCKGLGFMPQAAIIDYELTLSVPARITADTGIDALTHAIEAYVSRCANGYSDQQALAAMALIAKHIFTVYAEPANGVAREAMMLGSHLAGVAFSNASVALVHGMSRPIGAHFHVPHGLSNAMLLPLICEFSLPSAEARYAVCSRVMGVAESSDTDVVAGQKLLSFLRQLNQKLSVPSPKAYGINEQQYMDLLETMAEQALASGSPANNPRLADKAQLRELYRQAYSGS